MIECFKHFYIYHRDVLCNSFKPSPRKPDMLSQSRRASTGFYDRIQEFWNSLPPDVRRANNVNNFKNRLDRH